MLTAAGPDSGIGLLAVLSCIHIPLAGDTLHTTLAVSNISRTIFIHVFKLVGRLLGNSEKMYPLVLRNTFSLEINGSLAFQTPFSGYFSWLSGE